MSSINEITHNQIESLDEIQLTRLLKELLEREAIENSLNISELSVPLEITVSDGGEDGRIIWTDGLERTTWLPKRFSIFQVKATSLGPADCGKEILITKEIDGKESISIKPQVEAVFEGNGAYVLFKNKNLLNQFQIGQRITSIKEALKSAGKIYWETANIYVYDAYKITDWVNKFPQVVNFIWKEFFNVRKDKFNVWEIWEKSSPEYLKTPFVTNEGVNKLINSIIKIASGTQGIVRILGLSGLGKSKIVLETFRPPEPLSKFVLYLDASDYASDDNLYFLISDLAQTDKRCILIIDNCNLRRHKRLINETKNSSITLVTLSHEVENINDESDFIFLQPENVKDIIPQLIENLFPDISDPDRDKIVAFAMGFPLIAVLLAMDKTQGSSNLGRLNDKDLMNRMLGISSQDEVTRNMLRACAIFDFFGADGEVANQKNGIATSALLTRLNIAQDVAKMKIHEVCVTYQKRGIFEKRGKYLFIRPKPLALRLAEEWWEFCSPETIESILEYVTSIGLGTQLCDQMAKLDYLPEARELTKKLCGEGRPFGKAEVLNSELGSRLFRSLVEVNPEATIEALVRIFGNMPIEELRLLEDGRRNLVWALEKLVFRANIFPKAAKILLAFAAAENENIGNNSTGQFLQLFQIYLAGTEANLENRFKLIKFCLDSDKPEYNLLGLKAMSRALTTHHLGRMMGSEKQGSGIVLKDYQPDYYEIKQYWKNIIATLVEITLSTKLLSIEASQLLCDKLRSFVSIGLGKVILPAIEKIVAEGHYSWLVLLKSIDETMKFEKSFISDELHQKLIDVKNNITPIDITNRYQLIVSDPSWAEHWKNDDPTKDVNKRVSSFVEELIESGEVLGHLNEYFVGLQSQGFFFGEELGKRMRSNEGNVKDFFSAAIKTIKSIDFQSRNNIVLTGFIFGLGESKLKAQFLKEIIEDEELFYLAFNILASVGASFNEIKLLFSLVDTGKCRIGEFRAFSYGRALDQLQPDEVISLFQKISTYGIEGKWSSLALSDMYCYNDKSKWEQIKPLIREIIMSNNLLLYAEEFPLYSLEKYSWATCANKLIFNEILPSFAEKLMDDIIEFCEKVSLERFNYFDSEITIILNTLIERYFSGIWPALSKALLSENQHYMVYYHLKDLLESRTSFSSSQNGLLFKGDENLIWKWCAENSPIAPSRLINMAPLEEEVNGKITWHHLTKKILDNFGNDISVLDSLSSRMGTYSWTGSLVPLLYTQKSLLKELTEHKYVEVRKWSEKQLDYLEKKIEAERNYDEERTLF